MKEYMNEITSMEEFEKAYHEKGVQVFTFSADWCPDCQFIKGFMPDLVKAYPDYHSTMWTEISVWKLLRIR